MVFTATISQSVFLRVDLISSALYATPNSPAMNSKLQHCKAVQVVLECPSIYKYGRVR